MGARDGVVLECTGICLITPPDKLSRGMYTLVVSEIHWVHSVLDISASGVLQVGEAPMCHADSAPHAPSPEFAAKMTTYDWSKVTKADPKHYQTCPRLDFQTVSKRRSVGNGSSVSMGELALFFLFKKTKNVFFIHKTNVKKLGGNILLGDPPKKNRAPAAPKDFLRARSSEPLLTLWNVPYYL